MLADVPVPASLSFDPIIPGVHRLSGVIRSIRLRPYPAPLDRPPAGLACRCRDSGRGISKTFLMNAQKFVRTAVALWGGTLLTAATWAASASPAAVTARAVQQANAFLDTLSQPQRTAAVFAFTDQVQRKNWSNLPTPLYTRAGLRLADLTPKQREAALAALAALLSESGYQKIHDIMEGDELLRTPDNGKIIFGRDEFFISFVGTPSLTKPWTLQFGGHHLAINATVAGDKGVLTPSHTAAQPATYTLNGKTIRPLGAESDRAFALINSLNAAQQSKAIIGAKFRDLVLGPGKDGVNLVPEGIPASELTAEQQVQLWALAKEWVGIIHADAAAAKMTEIQSQVGQTFFAWSGPTTPGSAAYFRIQGPTVVIEFAPQSLGGSPINHIHTIYRDPSNEYGQKWWPK